MSRINDIESLISAAKKQLDDIKCKNETFIQSGGSGQGPQVLIKNFLENLKSALDYCAMDISEVVLNNKDELGKVYFPILEKGDKEAFSKLVSKRFRNLDSVNKVLFDYLEQCQPYHAENEWLADLKEMTNMIKHRNLAAQGKHERVKSFGLGEAIRVGGNAKVKIINTVIDGVVVNDLSIDKDTDFNKIDSRLMPWKKSEIYSVFQRLKLEVIPFLENALIKTKELIGQVYKLV